MTTLGIRLQSVGREAAALVGVLLCALTLGAVPAWASAPVATDAGVLFSFRAAGASSVHLAGEFNGWDPAALPMSDDDGDGTWEVVLELQAGRTFQYKFVLDGGARWEPDPDNPERADDGHGGYNSVLSVTGDGEVVLGPLGGPAVHEPIVDTLESVGRPISVAIVWHQHQPKYLKDLETGEYREPWVRMHCIKDYYDMVAILDDYPDIRFTVNLTPVLLVQLQEMIDAYESGGRVDEYLRATLKDAAELTPDDKVYLLTHFFNANWDNMIHVWPRYRELKDMKGGDSPAELRDSAARFSEQDWRDLQAWFNLAWFDPDFQEGVVELPDGTSVGVGHLIEKERGFTEADKLEIIEAQMSIMKNVVAVHRILQERGQIEVITTPYYHPILPLIYDTDLARVAMPGAAMPARRFSYPEDAAAQVRMAAEYYEELFGIPPSGMWPAEGSVAQEIVGTVADAGFTWMASDDQVLQRSLGVSSLAESQRYTMYLAGEGDETVAMIFRDHRLSDDIGFNFGRMNGVEAANSMMRSLYSIHRRFASDDRSHVVPIILDGENAWDWYRHDGKEFFHSWYDQMSRADWIETVTVSGYAAENPPTERIDRLWAGSWISHNFATWIGEVEENFAWDCLADARAAVDAASAREGADGDAIARAMDEIYAAEGSDWFWWYGSDQDSANDGAFDEMFRGTLANVYTILGVEPPDYLSRSILNVKAVGSPPASGGVMAKGEAQSAADAPLLAGPVAVDGGVLFSVMENSATSVHLAGEFNDWSTDAMPLSDEDGDGVWTVVVQLEPGSYEYKFAIDGGSRWIADDGNPNGVSDPYGGTNSVVVVE